MTNPNWSLGRTGQLYVGEESAYGVAKAPLLVTDAFRHLSQVLHFDPRTLAKGPERHPDPAQRALYTRRENGTFDIKGQWYPSGTLNVKPESEVFLKNSLGVAGASVVLSATVLTAASTPAEAAPTTTSFAVTDTTGLVANQAFVQIVLSTGASAGTYIRLVTAIAAANGTAPKKQITIAPPLPTAPILGDTVKGGITYLPATALPKSLDIAHYPQAPSANTPDREQLGCVCNKLSLMFDSNLEPMIQVSGPAQGFAVAAQTQPVGFTTVGLEGDIPSGLTGAFYYNGTLYQIEKLQLDVDNAMELQNTAFGTAKAGAFFRKGKRAVTLKVDAKVSDDLTMWSPSLAGTANPLFIQVGSAAGKIWGLYVPNAVIMPPPDIGDADETNNWQFLLTALSTAGNDELAIGLV